MQKISQKCDQPKQIKGRIRRRLILEKASAFQSIRTYTNYFQVSKLLGVDSNNIRAITSDVIKFEAKLAGIMLPDEERRDEDKIYKRLSISQLQKMAPFVSSYTFENSMHAKSCSMILYSTYFLQIRWKEFFAHAFQITNRTITDDQPVVLYAEDYLKSLNSLMNQYFSTAASAAAAAAASSRNTENKRK